MLPLPSALRSLNWYAWLHSAWLPSALQYSPAASGLSSLTVWRPTTSATSSGHTPGIWGIGGGGGDSGGGGGEGGGAAAQSAADPSSQAWPMGISSPSALQRRDASPPSALVPSRPLR